MPGPMGVISIPSDKKDAVISVDKMYREAVAAEVTALAKETKKKQKASMDVGKESEKCTSPEYVGPLMTCRKVPIARNQR